MKIKLFTSTIIIALLFISCKKEKTVNNQPTDLENSNELKNEINNKQNCFLYVMDNSYKKDGELITQKDHISINFSINGEKVEGEYKIISNKETINIGNFVGTITKNIITTINTYKKANKTFKDELIFKIEQHQLSILGGEKELINGVNMFVDKSKCNYMMQLPRIKCN